MAERGGPWKFVAPEVPHLAGEPINAKSTPVSQDDFATVFGDR